MVLITGAVPTLLPLVWLVRSALMDVGQIFISPPEWIPNPFAWDNFSGALTQVPFARYFLNTMIIEFGVAGRHAAHLLAGRVLVRPAALARTGTSSSAS